MLLEIKLETKSSIAFCACSMLRSFSTVNVNNKLCLGFYKPKPLGLKKMFAEKKVFYSGTGTRETTQQNLKIEEH